MKYYNMPLKNINIRNPFVSQIRFHIQNYNPHRYWDYRQKVQEYSGGKISKVINFLRLLYIKRCDAYNNASMGTDLGAGAKFASPPILMHGLNGIIVNPYSKIGLNCIIYHQVTIGDDGKDYENAPTIGDNVTIGAGAKVLGKIKIGDNVKIGAGCIVVEDIPDNATVVSPKAIIINRHH